MQRIWMIAAVQLALGAAWAQQTTVGTTVDAGVCAHFLVDGTRYTQRQTFVWPENSKHFLTLEIPTTIATDTRRCVSGGGWADSTGRSYQSRTIAIVANRAVTQYTASSEWEYLVVLVLSGAEAAEWRCGEDLSDRPEPWTQQDYGYLWMGDECVATPGKHWYAAGSALELRAHPPRYWAFKQWLTTVHAVPVPNASLSLIVDRPILVIAELTAATLVRFATEPAGMQLLVDQAPVPTPFVADWAYGSTHLISPVTPQYDRQGGAWAFEGWTDGGPEHRTYTADPAHMSVTFTARFKPGVRFGFNTQPVGLKLVVDGTERSHYNFLWPVGARHTVVAPPEQADSTGRRYAFNSWSNGGPPEQEVTVAATNEGMIARYDMLGRLTILSSPSGATVTVDGTACTTPCDVHRRAGEQVRIGVPSTTPASESVRMDFQSWSDGGPAERTWTATADAQTITGNFQVRYRLTATSDPPGAASFRFEPASPDGFYAAGSEVAVTAEPNAGYRLWYWDRGLDGVHPTATVWVREALNLLAVLEKVTIYGPAAVRSAAGETPDGAVAPGSLITIYGDNIAPRLEQGPESPLAQALAGVTVQVADRFLPLVFVSPDQIDAQLPSDLGEGEHELVVHYDGLVDIPAKFRTARNAPALFAETIDSRAFALAFHEDGSRVTPESPARRGETITLLGTGFGPYTTGALDGFAVPAGVRLELQDAVELRAGELTLQPESAPIAAEGRVGTVAVRLKIADPLPLAGTVELRAFVQGHASNMVLLPLK